MTTVNENFTDTTEEFAERMVGAIDSASLAILLSIGHQTKLFDTLAELPPATSAQIADAAGLNERYVREWLGGVVANRVVEYDPAAQTYSLPRERGAVLTRAAGPDNLSVLLNSFRCSARSSRRSSAASTTAVDCPTATIRGFTS